MSKANAEAPKEEKVTDGLGVYRGISRIIEELSKEGISKDQTNDQQKYKFRGIDDVYNALAPKLAKAGLMIVPHVKERLLEVRQTKSGGAMYSVTLCVDFTFISAEDGSREVITMYGEAMDSGDKATNKALSAAYKYACIQTFCIPTAGEDDPDKTTPEETTPSAAPKGLLSARSGPQAQVSSYTEHKAEYIIEAPVLPDGTLDYDAFSAGLEVALDGAKSMHDMSMLKKANSKILNTMMQDRPDLFAFLKDHFGKTGNRFA